MVLKGASLRPEVSRRTVRTFATAAAEASGRLSRKPPCSLRYPGVQWQELATTTSRTTSPASTARWPEVSEPAIEGHPDELCDQVSDAVLDACLTAYPKSKVAGETATRDNMVVVMGEITT